MIDEAVPVWLGAFGKHPGWDDHIADQGFETEFLVRVRRLLYVEGIGGNLDSGAWEELSEEERTPGYDHVFLWRTAEGLMVGRLWSSSDGKGRTRYPLVVCCQSRGLAGEWVVGPCLDRLEQLAGECRRVTSAGEMIGAVDAARADLRRAGRGAPVARLEALAPPSAMARLHDQYAAALGPEGLLRVSYQMEREFSAFLRMEEEGTGTRSRTVDVRPRHMRVPACERDMGKACALWMQFLYGRADPAAPALVFGRVGEGFVDIVVGEPGRGQVFCLQASAKRVPLTTEIPYNVDDAFRAEQAARVERGRTGELRDADLGAVAEELPRVRRRKPAGAHRGSRVGIVIAIIAILAAAGWAIKAVIASGGGGNKSPSPQKPEEDVTPVLQHPVKPDTPPADGEAVAKFSAWCLAYDGWLSHLVSSVKSGSDGLESDAYLSLHVRGPVLAAIAAKTELNPRYVVSNPPATARELADNVPAEVDSAAIVTATAQATGLIESVTQALERWPVRKEAEAMAETFGALGWTGPADELGALVRGVMPGDGVDIAAGVPKLVSAMQRPGLEQLVTAARQVQEHLARIERSDDKVLVRAASDLRGELKALAETPSLEAVLSRWTDVQGLAALTGRVHAFLDDGWGRVDRALFESHSPVHQPGAAGTGRALLQAWLSEAQREVYVAIDAELDPRRGWTIEADRTKLVADLKEVEERGGAETSAAVSVLRERLDEVGRQVEALMRPAWNAMTRDQIDANVERLSREVRLMESQVSELRADVSRDVNERLNEIRSRASVSEDGIAGVDELWMKGRDALLARYERDQDIRALTIAVRQLQGAVKQIEQASRAEGWETEVRSGWSRPTLISVVREARASAIREHAGSLDVAGASEAQVEAVCGAITGQVQGVVSGLRDALRRLGSVQEHIEQGYAWEEAWAEGGSIRQNLEAARAALPSIEQVAPELHVAVSRLEQVASAGRDELVRLAGESGFGPARVQAWRALDGVQPVWPADVRELLTDLGNLAEIRGVVQSIVDAGRRDALMGELEAASSLRWAGVMERADGWDALAACARLREPCGGQVASLSPARQWALSVVETQAAVAGGGDDADNQERARRLVEQARSLGVAELAAWVPVMGALDALAKEDLEAVPPLEPSKVGPGRVGWQVAPESTEERLVYQQRAGGARLGFRMVETPEGATYVGEEELSVGVVMAMIAADAKVGREFAALTDWRESAGLQVWSMRGSKDNPRVLLAPAWTASWIKPGVYYAAGFDPGKPTADHPMQRVSLSDAVYLAGQLGCRLPTLEEWRAALAAAGSPGLDAGWNLRDQSVDEQIAHLRVVDPSGQNTSLPRPDAMAFEIAAGANVGVYGFDDGVLWAGAVDGGPAVVFRNIIGNVQEYVIVSWSEKARSVLSGGGDPRERALGEWQDAVKGIDAAVVGGSMFSPPDRSVEEPQQPGDTRGGWSDVGLRVAFSPGEGRVRRSVAARLSEVLASAPFVKADGSR
ncbi:MAG: hypothetical protein DYG94_10605 [Leptolyngbya sp. PLA3]|nr:MAG: hypothetical protein EDM82_09170 [Cyanobacteria bacterium CYA]MCE7969182.1 hypothetical protein [Leptolyngbya sp. PL-A3]